MADADGALDMLSGGIQMAGQIVQGIQQQQMQALQNAQMMAQMQSLKVSAVPSKYFPQCPVLPGVTNFPEDACAMPSPGDEAGANRIQQFKALAIDNESVFEDMLSIGQNSRSPKGIQCLKDALGNTQSTLQDMKNNLQAQINQIKVANQQFKQNVTKIKEAMETTRAELYGNPKNQTDKSKNLMTEFSPTCRDYYGAEGKLMSNSGGFMGLRNEAEVKNSSAGKFLNNRSSYIAEVQSQISAIKNEIDKNGLAVTLEGNGLSNAYLESGSSTKFGSMDNILQAKKASFDREFNIIKGDLEDVGFNISVSDFDGDFQEKYGDFSKGAYQYFKKEAITACVNGTSNTIGMGLSTDQILAGLRSKVEGGSSTTLANYRTALQNILDSDAFIEDKMDAISKLDARFGVGNIYIQVQNADAQGVTMTPYGLYQSQIDACEARINQDDTFSTDSAKRATENSTYADRIAKAQKAIKKALALESKFQNELSTALYNRIVNCDGIQSKAESCEFGSDSTPDLETSSANFCIANATTCANQINSCYKEADKIIATKQTQMTAHAANYNAMVSAVIAQQQQILNQVKAQVLADSEYIKQYFPGASYEFPADLFVEMPEEMMVDSLGVALRGGENLATLDDLEKKMETLKEMLDGQGDKVEDVLTQYIADQQSSMQAEAKKWTALKDECKTAEQNYNKAVQEVNNKMAEDYNDALNFCQKYTALASNPAAGCGAGADSLYEDAMNVSSQYMADAGAIKAQAVQYQNFCNSVNNEGQNKNDTSSGKNNKASKETDSELMFDDLLYACTDEDDDKFKDDDDFFAEIKDQVLASLNINISDDDNDAIDEFFKDPTKGSGGFSREFKRTTWYRENLHPIVRGLEGYKDYKAPEYKEEDLKDTKLSTEQKATLTGLAAAWESKSFCERIGLEKQARAISECKNVTTSMTECIEKEEAKSFKTEQETPKAIARAIASVSDSVTQSDSGRIGEQMNGVPCMAQQGYNGASGGNIFSGLSQAAQQILGTGSNSSFGQ